MKNFMTVMYSDKCDKTYIKNLTGGSPTYSIDFYHPDQLDGMGFSDLLLVYLSDIAQEGLASVITNERNAVMLQLKESQSIYRIFDLEKYSALLENLREYALVNFSYVQIDNNCDCFLSTLEGNELIYSNSMGDKYERFIEKMRTESNSFLTKLHNCSNSAARIIEKQLAEIDKSTLALHDHQYVA